MSKSSIISIFLIIIITLFSCSKPQKKFEEINSDTLIKEQNTQITFFAERWIENYKNISTIGGGLLYGSVDICDKSHHAYDIGLKVANIYTMPSKLVSPLESILELDDYLTVISVERNSPSTKLIEPGDKIISIDGIEIFGEYALQNYESIINQDLLKKYEIKLKRDDNIETKIIQSSLKCAFNISVNFDNDRFNAWVDEYNNLTFSLRLAEWLKNDELATAVITSHELAHIIQNHIEIKKTNQRIAGIFGLALDIGAYTSGINTSGKIKSIAENIGANQYSKALEKEADYVGTYILARNGYDFEKLPMFWRKFSIEVPNSIYSSNSATHPSTSERAVLLEETIKEIKKKIENNEKLIPNED